MRKCYIIITNLIAISILLSLPVSASVDSGLFSTDSPSISDGVAPQVKSSPLSSEINNVVDVQSVEHDFSVGQGLLESENNNDIVGGFEVNTNKGVTSEVNNIYNKPSHQINQAPFADFKWTPMDTVILFESTSYDPDGEIVGYWWWYDDYELNASFFMSNEPIFNYTFPEPGHYDVTLKVIDNNCASDIITKTVIAYICYPPVADFTWSQIGDVIIFDGTTSYDPDGQITKYFWMYYTSYGKPIPLGHTAIINYSFSEPGTYNVSLTVTDNDGGSDTVIKTIDYILSSYLETNQLNSEELGSKELESDQIQLDSQLQNSLQQSNLDENQEHNIAFIPFSTQSTKTYEIGIFENVFLKINIMFLDLTIRLT